MLELDLESHIKESQTPSPPQVRPTSLEFHRHFQSTAKTIVSLKDYAY